MTGYANGKSGEVESLVTLQVRLLSRSAGVFFCDNHCDKDFFFVKLST